MTNTKLITTIIAASLLMSSAKGGVDDEVKQAVAKVAASCPQQINEYVTLVGVGVVGKTIIFTYSVAVDSSTIPATDLVQLKADTTTRFRNYVQSLPGYPHFKSTGYNIHVVVVDSSSRVISAFDVT
jgi:hypothetical protein